MLPNQSVREVRRPVPEPTTTEKSQCMKSLEKLIEPLAIGDFFQRYWGQSFIHVRGEATKFSHLLPWTELNQILQHYPLQPDRIKLVKSSRTVPYAEFLGVSNTARGWYLVKANELTNLLREGATLILNSVDDFYAPIRDLTTALERIFRIRISANMYAGWRTSNGFDLHFDDHDAMILQVAGNKRWRIYEPTYEYPFSEHLAIAQKPETAPVWDDIFRAGDFFYIPRGWWHVAFPMNEPCLHLTIGFRNPTGVSLLRWISEQLSSCRVARQDLPLLSNDDTREKYMNELRSALEQMWNSDLLENYIRFHDGRALPRPSVQLPTAATPDSLTLADSDWVKMTCPRFLDFSTVDADGRCRFTALGRQWRCPPAAVAVLLSLNNGDARRLSDLLSVCSASDVFVVRSILSAFVIAGLLNKLQPAICESLHELEGGEAAK